MTAPKKNFQDGRIDIKGKIFTWHTEDGNKLVLPLRVKVKVLRELNDLMLDADGMYQMAIAVAPDQAKVIDEMDLNDFTDGFNAWRAAYADLAGAGLGESSGSSS